MEIFVATFYIWVCTSQWGGGGGVRRTMIVTYSGRKSLKGVSVFQIFFFYLISISLPVATSCDVLQAGQRVNDRCFIFLLQNSSSWGYNITRHPPFFMEKRFSSSFFFFNKKSRDWTVSNKRFIFMSRFDLFILFGCVRFRLGTSFQAGGNIAPEKYRKYFSRIALFFSSINGTRHCWRSSPRITVSNQLPCSPIHALANAVQLYTFQSR